MEVRWGPQGLSRAGDRKMQPCNHYAIPEIAQSSIVRAVLLRGTIVAYFMEKEERGKKRAGGREKYSVIEG